MIAIIMRLLNLAAKPGVLSVFLAFVLAAWLLRGMQLFEDTSFTRQAERNRQELMANDPKAAAILARIDDQRHEHALLVASYSASEDGRRRSVLADMAAEVAATNELPYRARIAALAMDQVDLRDSKQREAYLVSHATACESLAVAGDWGVTNDYVSLLEQAAREPNVWPLVRDDPLALVLWRRLKDPKLRLLSFYHRNRDWLADPLAALDLSGVSSQWTVEAALAKLAQHETVLRKAVEQGRLGVYALAVTLTHGSLVDLCFDEHDLDPSEVISVIMFNRDVLDEREGDARWIGEKASWMAEIRQRHPTVWFAAARTPLALRLHRDAPDVTDTLLEKYGADEIAGLIYQHFEDADRVAAAASAIDRFGDLAIYVFARYEDKAFMNRLGEYLVDDKLGIRVIPFVIRFGDEAFSRIKDDPDWVERYFKPDGTPREDSLEWVQYVPGGAALQVARNWSAGHPCEWSELGWAAVDVADIALTIASFGSSKTITAPAKAVAKGAKVAAKAEAAGVKGARLAKKSTWKRALAEFRAAPAKTGKRMSRVAEVAETIKSGMVLSGQLIWGTVKLAKVPAKLMYRSAGRSLDAWKALSPTKKVWIYRSLLAVGLYVTVTERTLPNVDKISAGFGEMIAKAAAGTVALAGDALAAAVTAFTDQLTGGVRWVKRLVYWAVVGVLILLILRNLIRAARSRQQVVVVKG